MDDTFRQLKLLLKSVYLLFILSILFILFVFIYNYNPVSFEIDDDIKKSSWKPKSLITDIPSGLLGEEIKYGYLLIIKTSNHIGPLAKNESMRFAGNNLTCTNCHLNAGRKIGSGSFVGVMNRFPQFRGRENKIGTIEERINGCMQRSMNGQVLPEDGREMQAIISYMQWLSDDVPEEIEKLYKGYVKINLPDYKADSAIGRALYRVKCMVCHSENGEGKKYAESNNSDYLYPPIAGDDTFNDGAGMTRVITAAQFIKGNMPFGTAYDSPQLTDDEAYHIAAYVSTLPRPSKSNKELDFPDKKLKPVSTDYGPWADDFTPEQHKFGPFPPIIKYYKEQFDITKSK